MSKNIYKTPNSIENQINKIKQKNSSMFNNIVIFANVLTRNNFIEKSKKYALNLKELILVFLSKNSKNILPLKTPEKIEEIFYNKLKHKDLVRLEILSRQKIIVGRFTKRVLEQSIKKNQIGRAI